MHEFEQIVKNNGLELHWIDSMIGVRRGNIICLNKDIMRYPDYAVKTLYHELNHTSKATVKDFVIDCTEATLMDNLKFCLKHPKGWLTFMPVHKYQGEWYININVIIIIALWAISISLFLLL